MKKLSIIMLLCLPLCSCATVYRNHNVEKESQSIRQKPYAVTYDEFYKELPTSVVSSIAYNCFDVTGEAASNLEDKTYNIEKVDYDVDYSKNQSESDSVVSFSHSFDKKDIFHTIKRYLNTIPVKSNKDDFKYLYSKNGYDKLSNQFIIGKNYYEYKGEGKVVDPDSNEEIEVKVYFKWVEGYLEEHSYIPSKIYISKEKELEYPSLKMCNLKLSWGQKVKVIVG